MSDARYPSWLDRFALGRSRRYWRGVEARAAGADLARVRADLDRARQLNDTLSSVVRKAENRLQLPRIGSNSFPHPAEADWIWRPDLFRMPLPVKGRSGVPNRTMLGNEATLFHDSQFCEITMKQLRNTKVEDLAPYGLELEVFRFEGSFLSVVIDLPVEAAEGLRARHIMRVDAIVDCETDIEIYARLNVQHGPNCEQLVHKLPRNHANGFVEFDLSYTDFNEKRSDKLWLDLIFDTPQMNRIAIRDMTFSRSPRAEM